MVCPRRFCRAFDLYLVARKSLGAEDNLHGRRMRVGARLEHPLYVVDVVDVSVHVDVRVLRAEGARRESRPGAGSQKTYRCD